MLIYDKTVKYEFVEGSHKHMVSKLVKDDLWTVPTPVVGCTTVTSVISKPFLMLWPMNEALKYIRQEVAFDTELKAWFIKESDLKNAANAHKKKSDSGKHTGKVGHALVEALIQDKKVTMPSDPELLKQAESVKEAFESWREDFKPEVLKTEQPFYSLRHDYAGICDLVATIDDKVTVVDYKTTNTSRFNPLGIYTDNYCQLGGYILGLEEMLGITVDDAMVVNLSKNGEGYQAKSLSDMNLSVEEAKAYFINALGLYNLNKTFSWRLGA